MLNPIKSVKDYIDELVEIANEELYPQNSPTMVSVVISAFMAFLLITWISSSATIYGLLILLGAKTSFWICMLLGAPLAIILINALDEAVEPS